MILKKWWLIRFLKREGGLTAYASFEVYNVGSNANNWIDAIWYEKKFQKKSWGISWNNSAELVRVRT